VLSLYLLLAGHNQPGGGFVGGLVAAGAFALRALADGRRGLGRVPEASTLLSVGLVLATASALVPVLFGAAPLDHRAVEVDLPLFGAVKATSALVFDTGVYLVVVGLALGILVELGDDHADDGPD